MLRALCDKGAAQQSCSLMPDQHETAVNWKFRQDIKVSMDTIPWGRSISNVKALC